MSNASFGWLSFLPNLSLRDVWTVSQPVFCRWYLPLSAVVVAADLLTGRRDGAGRAAIATGAVTALCWLLIVRFPLGIFTTVVPLSVLPWPCLRPDQEQPAVWLTALLLSALLAGLLQSLVYRLLLHRRLTRSAYLRFCLAQLLCLSVAANRMAAWAWAHPPEA